MSFVVEAKAYIRLGVEVIADSRRWKLVFVVHEAVLPTAVYACVFRDTVFLVAAPG